MCNRVGREGAMDFAGESLVISADGRVLVKAEDAERIVYADINLKESEKIRRSKPYTSLRRTEMYL